MREEFLALFRDTTLSPPPGAPPTADETARGAEEYGGAELSGAELGGGPGARRGAPVAEPSRFLRRFLQQAAPTPEPAQSGLAGLDLCLGGGFGYGLHLVLGQPGSGKTAFLESVAWEAVAGQRPALYYALKTGTLRVWERLIVALGAILDGPVIAPTALRGRDFAPSDVEALARLDAILQVSVLPYLALIDASPASTATVSAFIEDMRSRLQESGEQHGRLPLVLVDDLESLTTLTGSQSAVRVLSRLDDALAGESTPGLLASPLEGVLDGRMEGLPVRTVLTLTPAFAPPGAATERVEVEVRKNAATGWTGGLSLLLDPGSGLLAEATAAGATCPGPEGDA
jgi:hypothetical protein